MLCYTVWDVLFRCAESRFLVSIVSKVATELLMESASLIFKRIRPKCVALVEVTFAEDFKSGTPEVVDTLKCLSIELNSSVKAFGGEENGSLVLPVNFAEYIMVPISKILHSKELSNTELEHVLSIILILLKYSWCQSGVLSRELFTQYVTLITFLIGGDPNDLTITGKSDETLLLGIQCLKELLVGSLNQGPSFTSDVLKDGNFVPTLGFLVNVFLNISVQSAIVEIRCQALSSLNVLFHLINDGEILSLFFPGVISSMAKIVKMRPHSAVIVQLYITMTTLTNLIFSDFDLEVEVEDFTASLESLKTTMEEDQDGLIKVIDSNSLISIKIPTDLSAAKKHRTSAWLSSTIIQFKKALSIILEIDLNRYDKKDVREVLFQFDVKVIRNCFFSCFSIIPSLIRSLSVICGNDPTFLSTTVDSLCYTSNHDNLKLLLQKILNKELVQLQQKFVSLDSLKAQRSIQLLTLIVNILNGMGGLDLQISGSILFKIRSCLAFYIEMKNTSDKRKKKVVPDLATNSIQSRLSLVSAHYTRGSFDDLEQPYIFSGLLPKDFEDQLTTLLGAIAHNVQSIDHLTKALDLDFSQSNRTALHVAVCNWIQSILVLKIQKEQIFNTDDFLNFDENEDEHFDAGTLEKDHGEQDKEIIVYNSSYSILGSCTDVLRQCSNDFSTDYSTVLSTVMSLRAINSCAIVLKEEFTEELIEVLYPIVECLSSENELIRTEAQIVTYTVAELLYEGSIQQMLSANTDYLIDALSFKLVGESLTPKIPIILSVLIRLGSLNVVSELEDIIKTMFTLLDVYHGYHSLVESFFLVFDEIISKIYDTLPNFDFETLIQELEEDNVQFFGMWGLKSDNEVQQFVSRKAVIMDQFTGDSDDDDDDSTSEETLKRQKPLDIDSDDSDDETDVRSIPSIKSSNITRNDEEEDEENSWVSPVEKNLFETLSNIMSYAERFMQTKTKNLTIFLLKIINRVIPLLATQKSRFLPIAANLWELIRHTIDTSNDIRIIGACVDTFENLIKFGNTFFTARYLEMYRSLVNHKVLAHIIQKEVKNWAKSKDSGIQKLVNRTSTSVNWESELFVKTANFVLFCLNKFGRYIPTDLAMSMISLTMCIERDPARYGYFDDMVVFLSQNLPEENSYYRIICLS